MAAVLGVFWTPLWLLRASLGPLWGHLELLGVTFWGLWRYFWLLWGALGVLWGSLEVPGTFWERLGVDFRNLGVFSDRLLDVFSAHFCCFFALFSGIVF